MAWGSLKATLKDQLPENLDDRERLAYDLVQELLNAVFGREKWESYKHPKRDGSGTTTYARRKGQQG
jgi:hypothetical protein